MDNDYANDSVERTYKSLVADLEGCTLYGRKLDEFENRQHAEVVAVYFLQFVTKASETEFVAPVKVFEK